MTDGFVKRPKRCEWPTSFSKGRKDEDVELSSGLPIPEVLPSTMVYNLVEKALILNNRGGEGDITFPADDTVQGGRAKTEGGEA